MNLKQLVNDGTILCVVDHYNNINKLSFSIKISHGKIDILINHNVKNIDRCD